MIIINVLFLYCFYFVLFLVHGRSKYLRNEKRSPSNITQCRGSALELTIEAAKVPGSDCRQC